MFLVWVNEHCCILLGVGVSNDFKAMPQIKISDASLTRVSRDTKPAGLGAISYFGVCPRDLFHTTRHNFDRRHRKELA